VHEGEEIDRRLVALDLGAPGLVEDSLAAEILEQQQAFVHIGSADFGRTAAGFRNCEPIATNGRTSSARCATAS
jgi:hypothetical protein